MHSSARAAGKSTLTAFGFSYFIIITSSHKGYSHEKIISMDLISIKAIPKITKCRIKTGLQFDGLKYEILFMIVGFYKIALRTSSSLQR